MTNNKINFRDRPLVFVDLETTGFNPDIHEIIEIGVIVAGGKTYKETKSLSAKIMPQNLMAADRKALKITNFSEEAWQGSRNLEEVLVELNNLAPGGMLFGWNVAFDWSFIEHNFNRHKIKSNFDYHRIDVLAIAYADLQKDADVDTLGLRKVAKHFKIPINEDVHSAVEDVRVTYEIFKLLMNK